MNKGIHNDVHEVAYRKTSQRFIGVTWMLLALNLLLCTSQIFAADSGEDLKREVEKLREQNNQLQHQMQKQQELIENLDRRLNQLQTSPPPSPTPRPTVPEPLPSTTSAKDSDTEGSIRTFAKSAFNKVQLTGEGGLALFRNEAHGKFPNGAMRVDEAKLFAETPVHEDIYFFGELNLFRRQDPNDAMNVGELYLDFENLSRWWKKDNQLSLRVGRIDVPFGEEYLTRDAIDNPLISHSLMDFWGVDEGIEAYGSFGKVHYVLAVQNGGHPSLNDYNSDKAITLRLGYEPTRWLHVGVSAMRTGGLDVQKDQLSELWFGDGFIRSLGSSNTTTFHAQLLQGDIGWHWNQGHLNLSGGYLRYGDNDPGVRNGRDVYFYSVEALQHFTRRFYTASRFSQILAHNGFPIVGDGQFDEYLFEALTENIWRLTFGFGYQLGSNLLLKTEYSFNQGREISGEKRRHENLFAAEIAFKF